MSIDHTPLYNLNAVLKKTGLKADLLRAWERRYQLPTPQRSTGGHRLYSAYDIEILKWLRTRQVEGLSISRAVDLWQEIVQSGCDPLISYNRSEAGSVEIPSSQDTRLDHLSNRWLEACLAFDDRQSEDALNQAFALYPVETVCLEILQPGLGLLGQAWYKGQASVQQEHFASALATRRLETLISATPAPTRRQTVLVGCPPAEWHTLPILMFSLFVRRRGLKVIYLGANIPALQIAETAAAIQPDLVVLAAQQLTSAASLQALAVSLQKLKLPLAYGGLIFNRIPSLRQRISGHFLGESLEEGLQTVENLLADLVPAPTALQVEDSTRRTARLFQDYRPLIERELAREIQRAGLEYNYIEEASLHFTNGLAAALDLGDISLLEADLNWVDQLHLGQQIPGERLIYFLNAYQRVLLKLTGEDSAAIVGWMDDYLSRYQP